MRNFFVMLILGATVSWSGSVSAAELPAKSDIEAVCGKFGPTNREFCLLVLQIYDAVDEINSQLGKVERAVDAIPQHPHMPFGYEATQQEIADLRASLEAETGKLKAAIDAIPQHPHMPFGYAAMQRDLEALRADVDELKSHQMDK